MCGISGFNWFDKSLIKEMCKLISHRGPDQEGYYTDKKVSLGHKRLSIIDLSDKGRQPMFSKDNRYIIVFNGEIYNYKEIKENLENKKYVFNTDSDTEVLLYAFEEYKEKCLNFLEGMFAFCVYDTKTDSYFIARDKLGIKPLYYFINQNKLAFSSELKPLLVHNFKKTINKEALQELFTYGLITEDRSIIKEIKKLPAGHFLKFTKGKTIVKKYWDIYDNTKSKESERFYINSMRKKILSSVEKRLVADVKVGCFLSGGIDSSIVTAAASKYKSNIDTFSVSFDINEFDETEYAKKVSDKFRTNHRIIDFTSEDIIKTIPKISKIIDEPFGEATSPATYLLCKETSKHVKVSLSGDGGDEVFGGYERYNLFKRIKKYQKLSKLIPSNFGNNSLRRFKYLSGLKDSDIYSEIRNINSNRENLVNTKFTNYYKKFFKFDNYLDNITYCDLKQYTCNDLLKNLDLNSMRFGLEARVPLLDSNIVTEGFKIPNKFKIKNGEKKYILKKIALSLGIPKDCIYRKKRGFSIPLNKYYRNELKGYVEENLLNNKNLFNYVSKEKVRKIVNDHFLEKVNNASLISTLLYFEGWLREVEELLK